MRQVLYPIPLLVLILCFGSCSSPTKITSKDIKSAQKLFGVEFSEKEINTMTNYLNDNRKGYDSMRTFKLDYGVAPAMQFNPFPDSFQFKTRSARYDFKLRTTVRKPSTEDSIAFLSVADLSVLIRNKQITSTELTKIYLARLKKFDTLQAVVTITEELALKQAALADAEMAQGKYRGPLHGMPYGIKDLFAVPGYKTTWGAEPYKNQTIDETAVIVKKLEEAGAVLVAKLTSGALARGDVWFGGKTKNPWDLSQGASGSSAGSASATAAGLVAFSIGTETLGSIVAPSSRCGATGLRPTYGSVSRTGAMTLSWSMDKAGPICRTAQDCAIVFSVIKGNEGKWNQDRGLVDYDWGFNPPENLKGYKIGYFKKFFDKDTTRTHIPDSLALEVFKKLGAELIEIPFPKESPYDVFDVILRAEAGAFFDELVLEHKDRELGEQDAPSRANSLRQARFIPAAEYLQANRHRKVLIEKFYDVTKNFDFILSPSSGERMNLTTNLTGNPAMVIPTGLDKKGRPTSITLLGNLYDEGPMLEAAYLFQQTTEFEEKRPPLFLGSKK
jgi:Asp-tRNA(Asn)/Glu-tRNA(Gln) amidotransferase A subunit family amidase